MKSILFFDAMLTPKVITFVYWLSLLGILFGGIGAVLYGKVLTGLLGMVVAGVFVRLTFEMIIVLFKNNEYLRKIADKS